MANDINVDNNSNNVLTDTVKKKHINYPMAPDVIAKMKSLAALKGMNAADMWELAAKECLEKYGMPITE